MGMLETSFGNMSIPIGRKSLEWWPYCLRCVHDKDKAYCNMCIRNAYAPSSDKKVDYFEDWLPDREERDSHARNFS